MVHHEALSLPGGVEGDQDDDVKGYAADGRGVVLEETVLAAIADELATAIDRDASSYDAVMAAFKMPQGNDGEKTARRPASPLPL